MNTVLFEEFLMICKSLNQVGIQPTLMGSLGLEIRTQETWYPQDIDIHVPGDPRGWQAPDEERIYQFEIILTLMNQLGYQLVDRHEHEFSNGQTSVEFGCIDTLPDFADIPLANLPVIHIGEATFKLPNLSHFLKIYQSSSQDSYRNDQNNHKDFEKIAFLKQLLKEEE